MGTRVTTCHNARHEETTDNVDGIPKAEVDAYKESQSADELVKE